MIKAIKFRLYPTIDQMSQLNQHIGSCRFVYNWALDQNVKTYEQTGKSISGFDLNKLIPTLKKQNPWLGDVYSQSLQGMTKQVESAFTKFFREKGVFLNSNLTLKDREWICPDRKTLHDRDINAAINIKKFSLIDQNLIGIY